MCIHFKMNVAFEWYYSNIPYTPTPPLFPLVCHGNDLKAETSQQEIHPSDPSWVVTQDHASSPACTGLNMLPTTLKEYMHTQTWTCALSLFINAVTNTSRPQTCLKCKFR